MRTVSTMIISTVRESKMTLNLNILMAAVVAAATFGILNSAKAETVQDQVKPADATSATASGKKKKSTDMSFEDVLVQGKYHFSDEAVTTVEDDKVLDALLGVRTDFKDRIKKSTARH